MASVKLACQNQHGLRLDLYSLNGSGAVLVGSADLAGHVATADPDYWHVAGTGFTEVSSEFWEAWLSQNQESPLLLQGIVYEVM